VSEKVPIPDPFVVNQYVLSLNFGFGFMLQQMPRCVMGHPPSLVIFALIKALFIVIFEIVGLLLIDANTPVFKEYSAPYPVPFALVA
jgi:hypothetical protein